MSHATQHTCPACVRPFALGDGCPCGEVGAPDDVLIVRATRRDRKWHEQPKWFRKSVRRAADLAELLAQDRRHEQRAAPLLDPRLCAIATLPGVRPGDRVLVIGGRWAVAPQALGFLGGTVVLADVSYDRLRFNTLANDSAVAGSWLLDLERALPWSDGEFDVVLVDLADLTDHGMSRGRVRRLLAELARLIGEEGTVLIATRNPLAVALWNRDKRGLARGLPAAARRAGFRTILSPWNAVIRGTGLDPHHVHVPWPSLDSPHAFLPRGVQPVTDTTDRATLRRRVTRSTRLHRDLVIIASRGASTREAIGIELVGPQATTITCSDLRIAVDSSRGFVKVPLCKEQELEIADEIARTQAAADGPLASIVPAGAKLLPWRNTWIGAFPHLDRQPADWAAVDRRATQELRSLTWTESLLEDTELYCRISSPAYPENLRFKNVARLVRIARSQSRIRIPTGPVHGDLDTDNVLTTDGHAVMFVDWQRGSANDPLFLDPLTLALSLYRQRSGALLSDAVHAALEGEVGGVAFELARERMGDLSLRSALALYVLHLITSQAYSSYDYPPDRESLRAAKVIAKRNRG